MVERVTNEQVTSYISKIVMDHMGQILKLKNDKAHVKALNISLKQYFNLLAQVEGNVAKDHELNTFSSMIAESIPSNDYTVFDYQGSKAKDISKNMNSIIKNTEIYFKLVDFISDKLIIKLDKMGYSFEILFNLVRDYPYQDIDFLGKEEQVLEYICMISIYRFVFSVLIPRVDPSEIEGLEIDSYLGNLYDSNMLP